MALIPAVCCFSPDFRNILLKYFAAMVSVTKGQCKVSMAGAKRNGATTFMSL